VNQIVQYKEQVKRQKKKEGKPVEVEGVEEWEVEKILNNRKIRGVEKHLVIRQEYGQTLGRVRVRTDIGQ